MIGRSKTTLEPIADPHAFPSGMKALGNYVHGLGFGFGLYTTRGTYQCARPEYKQRCLHTPPNPKEGCEGSQGYEKSDAKWFVSQGADYLKEDSCGDPYGGFNLTTAFADYTRMRDALNTSGRPVYFSLCGWHSWYAAPDPRVGYPGGAAMANSWRIYRDGKNWAALSTAVNVMAQLTHYTGPGGWNDPDLLIGPTCHIQGIACGQTDIQARTQFNLWGIFPAPLLLSQDPLGWSAFALATYSNAAIISVNQDPLGQAALRLEGDNLTYPCAGGAQQHGGVQSTPQCTNVWGRELSGGRRALVFVNNGPDGVHVMCGDECLGQLSLPAPEYHVKDLWGTGGVPSLLPRDHTTGKFFLSVLVGADGDSRAIELTPSHNSTGYTV